MRGVVVDRREFIKPSMTGLKGKTGKRIVNHLKNSTVKTDDNIKRRVSRYKKSIMIERNKW